MVFSSPWLTAEKELTHHEGTALFEAIFIGQQPLQFTPGDLVGLLYSNRFGIGIPPGQGILDLVLPEQQQHGDQLVTGWQPDSWLVLQINSFGRMNSGETDGDLIVGGGMGIGEGIKVA
nr:hypothetical protein [Tanacetum cinerariifolium]